MAATRKFRDTLTGRKVIIHLSPVLWSECRDDFGIADLDRRRHHGGPADYSALSQEYDISRQTVKTYLEALSIACAVIFVPPFHGGGRRKLEKRPKVYGIDTGFVTYARGWTDVRDDDRGLLWEHLVLDSLRAKTGGEGRNLLVCPGTEKYITAF